MSLSYEDLCESERCVWNTIESGALADPRTSDPPAGGTWRNRMVRAQLLIELLTTEPNRSGRRPRALRLRGARITGELDLAAMTLVCPLALEACFFDRPISFDEASAPRVELSACHVETFTARQLETRGDLVLRRLTARQVTLLGARVGGKLDLSGARLANPKGPALSADRLRVDQDMFCREQFTACGEVSLHGAHIGGQLDFSGARLANSAGPALSADGLQVDQSMFCAQVLELRAGVPRRRTRRRPQAAARGEPFTASGELSLLGARVRGQLDFSGARLRNADEPALSADRLQVDQDMFCREQFKACGEVSLHGAHIGGRLDFSGARLENSAGPALSADGLEVDQGMFCSTWEIEGRVRRFYAKGKTRLVGAHIRGSLNFKGATLRNRSGPALDADALHVDQDMLCGTGGSDDHPRRFFAEGGVRLPRAQIGGKLDFDGARLRTPSGRALYLERAEAVELCLPQQTLLEGIVDLTDARVARLHDEWRPAGRRSRLRSAISRIRSRGRCTQEDGQSFRYGLRVTGFVYESLPEDSHAKSRLDWIARAERESVREERESGYLPGAYDQLAAVFRRAGLEEDARKVAIAKLRRRRKKLRPPASWWNRLLDWSVGYGYRTWRAVLGLLGVMAIGWLVFELAGDRLRPVKPEKQLPEFAPWLYSIDSVLPVINLGQESAWTATGAAQYWYAFSVLAGWVLATALVAVLTATLFRE